LLPQKLLRASVHLEGERIVPHYFTARDEPWLRALVDEYRRFSGKKRAELYERLREPLPARAPKIKLRIAMRVLDALCLDRPIAAIPPKEARAALFRTAVNDPPPRDAVLGSVAASFAVSAVELERALFADLRSERRIELPTEIAPTRIVSDANLAIVSALVGRATNVRIVVRGSARALVRQARVMGLICRVSRAVEPADSVTLEVSGPFALFRHSEIYGRALASLVSQLAHCADFELTAACALDRGARPSSFVVGSGGPIASAREPALHGTTLFDRFERDFARAAPDWHVLRDPPAIAAGKTLIFPDFELVHRHDSNRRWWLEFVGFWTPKYLREKLTALDAFEIDHLLLCVDHNRHCAEGDPPADARVIQHKKKIDPRAVLAVIDRSLPALRQASPKR